MASRLVICPFTKSFYQDKTHNEHVTGELPDDPEWKRWATQQSAIRCNGLFGHYDIEGNRVLKQAHDEFVDANDYVRMFMRQFAAELDEASVDCVPMPALHEAFKEYFREKISQRGASASFDGEFKLSQADTGFLPNRNLVFWQYSDMTDDRFATDGKKVTLTWKDRPPFKVGALIDDGKITIRTKGVVFTKSFGYEAGADYPDMQCNAELYTNELMFEVESLSPHLTLEPGESAEHVEVWTLEKE